MVSTVRMCSGESLVFQARAIEDGVLEASPDRMVETTGDDRFDVRIPWEVAEGISLPRMSERGLHEILVDQPQIACMDMSDCVHALIEIAPEPNFAFHQAHRFNVAELRFPVGLGLANLSKPIFPDQENIIGVATCYEAAQPRIQSAAGVSDNVKYSDLRPVSEYPGHHPLIQVHLENGIRLFQPALATDPPGHLPLALPQAWLHESHKATALGSRDQPRDARHLRQPVDMSFRACNWMISLTHSAARRHNDLIPKTLHVGCRFAGLPDVWNLIEWRSGDVVRLAATVSQRTCVEN